VSVVCLVQYSMRKIIHVDMDAFYASVEERDHPQWKGFPIVVGGTPQSRGVVCAANYRAREFGIHSAMPCATAYKLCPEAIFIRPNFHKYREVSQQVQSIFKDYTDLIQPLSLDEAWLDVSRNKTDNPSATWIAREIKERVNKTTSLTCSAGVSYNKMLAKIASDHQKPNGLTTIPPSEARSFLEEISLAKIPGVGKVFFESLQNQGLRTGKDVLAYSLPEFVELFPHRGASLYRKLLGEDHSPVKNDSVRKSISVETTFHKDLPANQEFLDQWRLLCQEFCKRLERNNLRGRTFVLKLKCNNFRQITRNFQNSESEIEEEDLYNRCVSTLKNLLPTIEEKEFRLIGIGLTNLEDEKKSQPSLAGHFQEKRSSRV